MKAVIRISTRLRPSAPIPREFLPIAGIEYLGLIYQQRIITDAVDFNETLAKVNDSRFPSRGCQFFPYLLTAEDEEKMNSASSLPDKTSSSSFASHPDANSKFFLDGKGIFMEGKRVAGIFGDFDQLRVLAAYTDLRPEIEAWLETQPSKPNHERSLQLS